VQLVKEPKRLKNPNFLKFIKSEKKLRNCIYFQHYVSILIIHYFFSNHFDIRLLAIFTFVKRGPVEFVESGVVEFVVPVEVEFVVSVELVGSEELLGVLVELLGIVVFVFGLVLVPLVELETGSSGGG
jgi:hypothetical protein